MRRYRVYDAPEGDDMAFCGEFATKQEAQEFAATQPRGLERSLWDAASAAGHCAGMYAPSGGCEADEPLSWHGENHCVVAVDYE